jgi:hypothetical protein
MDGDGRSFLRPTLAAALTSAEALAAAWEEAPRRLQSGE